MTRRTQPAPTPATGPSCHDLVIKEIKDLPVASPKAIALLEQRKNQGLETYGQPLQIRNGRCFAVDALEEAADMVVYLKGLALETKTKAHQDLDNRAFNFYLLMVQVLGAQW